MAASSFALSGTASWASTRRAVVAKAETRWSGAVPAQDVEMRRAPGGNVLVAVAIGDGATDHQQQNPGQRMQDPPHVAPDLAHAWRDLKQHFLAHQTFRDLDALDQAIHTAVTNLNNKRKSKMCADLRIAA
jgi:hypothetical protein